MIVKETLKENLCEIHSDSVECVGRSHGDPDAGSKQAHGLSWPDNRMDVWGTSWLRKPATETLHVCMGLRITLRSVDA
jgi:hypothetical protein